MKNPVVKKLLAYILVGAMTISTPITALASEHSVIADAYSEGESDDNKSEGDKSDDDKSDDDKSDDDKSDDDKSDDDKSDDDKSDDDKSDDDKSDDDKSDPKTDDKSKIDPINPDYVVDITGLVLDKDGLTLDVEDYKSDKVQARVLFKDYDPEDEEMVLAVDQKEREEVNKNLRWVVTPKKGVISTTPYKGTDGTVDKSIRNVTAVGGGVATLTAYLDTNGNAEWDDDEFGDSIDVTVKAYLTEEDMKKAFALPEEGLYLKHTYDMMKFFEFPEHAYGEKITFYVQGDAKKGYPKQTTITADGKFTIKKKVDANISVVAVSEHGIQSPVVTVPVMDGTPAKTVTVAKTLSLDFGKENERSKSVTATVSTGATDAIIWTSKNAKIADVSYDSPYSFGEANADGIKKRIYDYAKTYKATITATGVGSTTITGVASNGKKATIKVTVAATPDHIKIAYKGNTSDETHTIYTGKKPQLSIVAYATDNMVIPNGKTKFKWSVTKSEGFGKAKSKISNKGILTPPIIVEGDKGEVTVKAEINKTSINDTITFDVKQMIVTPNVQLYTEKYKGVENDPAFIKYPIDKKNLPKVCVGAPVKYTAIVNAKDKAGNAIGATEALEGLDWTATGAGTASDEGVITATKGGKITLKLGYVADKNGKLKFVTQNYTIESQQKASSLVFKKDIFAVTKSDKAAKKVTFQIGQQLPKGAKDEITWKYVALYPDGTMERDTTTTGAKIKIDPKSKNSDKKKNTKGIFDVSACDEGTVVKVGAYTSAGIAAYGYIYVVPTTDKRVDNYLTSEVVNAKKKISVDLGAKEGKQIIDTTKCLPLIKKNEGYKLEPVTFSVDKKGVNIVSVSPNGTIYGLAPGTTKVTVTSASGKKAVVTVTVNATSAPAK